MYFHDIKLYLHDIFTCVHARTVRRTYVKKKVRQEELPMRLPYEKQSNGALLLPNKKNKNCKKVSIKDTIHLYQMKSNILDLLYLDMN